jgi:hypothetical protein
VSLPDFLARYSTVLSAIVALTSTPTRTKQPQAADLVPPSTDYYVRTPPIPPQVAGSASGTPTPALRKDKTMVPHLHSVLRVPDLHAVAAARRFIKRTSLSLNNPHARTRHPARWRAPSSDAMQAPGIKDRTTSVALAERRYHTCAFSCSAYARCSLQARRMPCLCFAATDPQASIRPPPQLHCGLHCGL